MNDLNDRVIYVMQKMFPFIDTIHFGYDDIIIFISIPTFIKNHPDITPDPYFKGRVSSNIDFTYLSSLIQREGDYKEIEEYIDNIDNQIEDKFLRIMNMLYPDKKNRMNIIYRFNNY